MSNERDRQPVQRRSAEAPSGGARSIAPGKVTPASKLSMNRSAVQRQEAPGGTGATGQELTRRSAWEQTTDPWMDAAHRGAQAQGAQADAPVQRRTSSRFDRHDEIRRASPGGGSSDLNPRFDQNPDIANAIAETDYIRQGDTGMEVRIIQQGLIDAGYELPVHGVDGVFQAETRAAVVRFQTDQGIAPDGVVGPDTMRELSGVHDTHRTVVSIAQSHDPANPQAGTRTLTAEEGAAFNQAISTEPRNPDGSQPTFQQTTPAGDYEARIRARMQETIDRFHADYQQKEARRGQPDSLHAWNDIETVAVASKRETDRVFGTYRTGPPFQQGVNLFDAWEEESNTLASDPDYPDFIVEDLATYLLNNYTEDINEEHGAVASRSPERDILERVKTDFMASHRQELLHIQVAWPGLADEGRISIQRFRGADNDENRDFMWEQFATIIHEYIHTLEDPAHQAYRGPMDEQSGGLTLREGMCDYFTKMVWDTVSFTPALRQEVEGPYGEAGVTHPIPEPGFYDSVVQAERAVGIVGVSNAMAAFFLGRVDLIGGP
ncbi:MAG TPA: peptidoglycan-binding domain-containing protein [Haliangium sp.]|nr:peptidoglycan-binding domain-containing protein [Haliangium sp.]